MIRRKSPNSKKVLLGDKLLKTATLEEVSENFAFVHMKEDNFFAAKDKFWLYFTDCQESTKKVCTGDFNMLLFPHKHRFNLEASPITDVWKKSHTKNFNGSEHIFGLVEGFANKDTILIEMMSVRKSFRRNGITKFMIDALVAHFPDATLTFEDLTEDGYLFMREVYPDAQVKWTHSIRPESWKMDNPPA